MKRLSLNTYIAVGLLFWALPAVLIGAPRAAEYAAIAALLVWLLRFQAREDECCTPHLSNSAYRLLACFSLLYLIFDATLGRRLLQQNMFLHGIGGAAHEVEQVVSTMGQGGGLIDLLGVILELLPFALIDASKRAPRREKFLLWAVAAAFLFYETASGRGFLLMSVLAIFLGSGSSMTGGSANLRRMLVGGTLALGAFAAASAFRGDFGGGMNPLFAGIAAPFLNLQLLLAGECGHAPWYSFFFEFLKKFLPAFIFPKTIFSFNAEMSLCLNPLDPNLTYGVSVFTWLGEVYYYVPSFMTVVLAGLIGGCLGRAVDRAIVRNGMDSCRLIAGFLCILITRSRVEDLFSFLIAQLILFSLLWPALRSAEAKFHRYFILSRWRGEADSPPQSAAG